MFYVKFVSVKFVSDLNATISRVVGLFEGNGSDQEGEITARNLEIELAKLSIS